jgi:ribosomal protein S18 acetylase RimI-like enzyme
VAHWRSCSTGGCAGRYSPGVPYRKAEIRPYRDDDEALLFGRARMAFGDRSGWSDRRTLAVLEGAEVFVAEIEGYPAGFVALEPAEDAVLIEQLFVSPEHEAEGVGHQLLDWAEGYAISVRARLMRVSVEPDNRRARDFYRRSGFVPVQDDLLELILPQQ